MSEPDAFFEPHDDRQRREHLETLKAEAQLTGAVRRRAIKALREEYRLIYWERGGRVIIERRPHAGD